MSDPRMHPLPRWPAVAREQFLLLGVSLRAAALLFGGTLLLVTVLTVLSWADTRGNPDAHFGYVLHPDAAMPLIVLAFFFPMAVWKSEEPSRRGYHWAMPVARQSHTLTRVLFGWVWLLAALGAYVAWLAVTSLLATESARAQAPELQAWQWLVPVAAVTIGYLLGSTVVVASDHPWRWFVGIPVGVLVLGVTANAVRLEAIPELLTQLWSGRWGLGTALNGMVQYAEVVPQEDGRVLVRAESRADARAWTGATLLWLGLGLAAVLTAAGRHQER